MSTSTKYLKKALANLIKKKSEDFLPKENLLKQNSWAWKNKMPAIVKDACFFMATLKFQDGIQLITLTFSAHTDKTHRSSVSTKLFRHPFNGTTSKQNMRYKSILILSTVILSWSCAPSTERVVDLNTQNWIHGSENCEENIDPPIQVVQYSSNTWILRQNKCTNQKRLLYFYLSVMTKRY